MIARSEGMTSSAVTLQGVHLLYRHSNETIKRTINLDDRHMPLLDYF